MHNWCFWWRDIRGPWVGGKGGRGGRNFLKNHTSTIWSVKSAAKKLIKTNILPLKKRGGQYFFQFFPSCLWESWNLTAIWQLSCSFFYVKTKRKKIEGGIFGDFFSFEGGTMVFFICSILHTTFIHVYLNKLSHTFVIKWQGQNNDEKK